VSHSYDKGGTYQVRLNVTNDVGVSSLKTFTITVGGPLVDILLLSKVLLAIMLAALILIFAFLLIKRRTTRPPSSGDGPDALGKKQSSTPANLFILRNQLAWRARP